MIQYNKIGDFMRKLSLIAMLIAISMCIFTIEMFIPMPVPFPGVKCGLSNVIILVTLFLLGRSDAAKVLFIKIILTSLLFSQGMSIFYSLAGGISAFFTMALLKKPLNDVPWVVSVFGAIAHNTGQIIMACIIMNTTAIFSYFPILIISAIITGAFTGIIAQITLKSKYIQKLFGEIKK